MTSAMLPPGIARVSRVPHRLLTWGLPLGPLTLLRTRGRRTGLPRTVLVVVYAHGGRHWLVSPFGETAWVRNARADGRAELGRGRRFRPVRLREIDDERTPAVLRGYRRRFGFVPFVRQAFDTGSGHRPAFLIETGR